MIGFYNYTVWLTYASLVSSIIGLLLGFRGYPVHASLCLLVCGALDSFDGAVAHTKKDRTEKERRYGIQIDSLSDLVAFGVLPDAIGYGLFFAENDPVWMVVLYMASSCLFTLAAMIRLANFNVEEELCQKATTKKRTFYSGVPVTVAAGAVPLLVILVKLLDLGVLGFVLFVASMPVLGLLFLLKRIHIPKPTAKSIVVIFLCGVAELVLLLCCL